MPITGETPIGIGDIVALQGTLDTFALPDVLALLATAKKTGCLHLSGERGTGSVWVSDGTLSALEVPHAPYASEPVAALFELLRFDTGDFTFDAEAVHDGPGFVGDVMALLGEAEALLGEWREIQAVVPSMDAWVRLCKVLPGAEIVITQPSWDAIVAVASGATLRSVADALDLTEVSASRNIKALVELGILAVDPMAPVPAATLVPDPVPTATLAPDPVPAVTLVPDPVPVATLVPDPVPAVTSLAAVNGPKAVARAPRIAAAEVTEPERFVPFEFPGYATPKSYDPVEEDPTEDLSGAFPGLCDSRGDGPGEDDVDQHLAQLSPEAAEAVRLVVSGEAEGALEGSEPSEPSAGRGMLGKFLSSVKS